MRILFTDQFSELGGAQIGLREILDEVIRRGWKATVMAPGTGPLHQACADRGIASHQLPLARYANGHKTAVDVLRYGVDSMRAAAAIRDTAARFKPDLLYVNGPRALLAATLSARSIRCPIVFHAHSFLDRRYTQRIARWCVSASSMQIVAISDFAARPFAHCRVVYNGVKDHGFVFRPRTESIRIGIIGRISPEKGHLDFVRAAKKMAAMKPDLRFVVFGAALFADNSFEQQVRAAAEGAQVEFRGWTDDVAGALHEIDILAVPSGPAEGATRVIMEAFSAGTPVVAYPSGGIPELVRHGETGFLTDARNADSLAATLGNLLDDPEAMARLSTQGRREWENRFRIERCQSELCAFIEAAVA